MTERPKGTQDPIAQLEKAAQESSKAAIYEEVRARQERVAKLQKEILKDMRAAYKALVALDERYQLKRLAKQGATPPAEAHAAVDAVVRTFKADLAAYQNTEMLFASTAEERRALNEKFKFLERSLTLPQKIQVMIDQIGNETLSKFLNLTQQFDRRLKQYGYPDVCRYDRP